jgi:hypothetical protein
MPKLLGNDNNPYLLYPISCIILTINTKVNHRPLWCLYAFSPSPMVVGVTKLCSFVRWLGSVGKNGRRVKLPNNDNVDWGSLANLGWSAKAPNTEDGCQCLLYEMKMEILIVTGWVGCHETTKGLNLRAPMVKFQVTPYKIKHAGVVWFLFLIKNLYFIRVVSGKDWRINVLKTNVLRLCFYILWSTTIIRVNACYYSDLRDGITSYSKNQFLLMKFSWLFGH